jgi:hypothetical protein
MRWAWYVVEQGGVYLLRNLIDVISSLDLDDFRWLTCTPLLTASRSCQQSPPTATQATPHRTRNEINNLLDWKEAYRECVIDPGIRRPRYGTQPSLGGGVSSWIA